MKDYTLVIASNKQIANKVFRTQFISDEPLPKFRGGQFLHLQVPGKVLRRPFGILEMTSNTVSIVYAVVGEGTQILSQMKEGEALKAMLPLGNGFILPKTYKKVALLGGGLGAVPLLPVINTYPDIEFYSYMGFRTKDDVILYDEFNKLSKKTCFATEDGSFGCRGYSLDALKEDLKTNNFDAVLVCGSKPMLQAVKNANLDIPVYVSMEERMGCGVGACLVCVCEVKKGENVENLRVCLEGPVFMLDEVTL
ncbi:MAG TPA: dihydroorotate dehydrogenase electron transfer subunit [Clostridia bacterium]